MNPFNNIPDTLHPIILNAFYSNEMIFEDNPSHIFKMLTDNIKTPFLVIETNGKKEIKLLRSHKSQTLKLGHNFIKTNSKGDLIQVDFDNIM